jgi:hypothetical protein
VNLFLVIARWFWVLCLLMSFVNAASFWSRARRRFEARPELREGYVTLVKGFLTWGNLPWVVMGIGSTVGGIHSVFAFFRPRDGNPYVLAYFGSVFLVGVLGTYWIVFRGGAQMLIDHPGFFNIEMKSRRSVIAIWFAGLLGTIVAAVWMFFGNFPASPM